MGDTLRAGGKAAAWAAAGAIGATVLTGIAFADTTPAPRPATQTQGTAGQNADHPARRLAQRVMHGELVVKGKDGKPVTVAVQSGAVTAVNGDSVTVKSEDGFTKTWTLTADTKVRKGRAAATRADITVGATVHVGSGTTGQTGTAARVIIRDPNATAAPSANGAADLGDWAAEAA